MAEPSAVLPAPVAGYAPTRHHVAAIHRDAEELRIGLLVHDTGLMGIHVRTWRPGPGGELVEDPGRKLTVRLQEVSALVAALQSAADLAAEMANGAHVAGTERA